MVGATAGQRRTLSKSSPPDARSTAVVPTGAACCRPPCMLRVAACLLDTHASCSVPARARSTHLEQEVAVHKPGGVAQAHELQHLGHLCVWVCVRLSVMAA